jgi:GT2 family glycosyltransferase
VIVDNSPNNELEHYAEKWNVIYIRPEKNIGFGKANNLAIKYMLENYPSKYHIVVNPDVVVENGCVDALFKFMNEHNEAGMCTPRVVYPNGDLQYSQRLLPSPITLIYRRFIGKISFFEKKNILFEMQNYDHDSVFEVPFVCGCFMFIRTEIFSETGLFDERFFLYFEDTDLSRRIFRKFKVLYCPDGSVVHEFQKDSYHSWKGLKHHIKSAFQYFTKWGWCFDKERRLTNKRLSQKL